MTGDEKMDTVKKIIISSVCVLTGFGSCFAILLIIKSKNIKRDVTYPLLTSVFATGITATVLYGLISAAGFGNFQDNLVITKLAFFCQLHASATNYVSMAILSSLKFLALVKPFTYKRKVKVRVVKTITVTVWITLAFALSLVVFFSSLKFSSFTETVRYDVTKPEETRGMYFTRSLLYICVIILVLSSIGFVTGAVRYKIRTRNVLKPDDMLVNKRQRKAVARVLWSSKGVWVLAVIHLFFHLPFFVLAETKLRESSSSFFVLWLLAFTVPVWDVVCYIVFHKELRKLACEMICWWKPRESTVDKQVPKSTQSNCNVSFAVLGARQPVASVLTNAHNMEQPKDLEHGKTKSKNQSVYVNHM